MNLEKIVLAKMWRIHWKKVKQRGINKGPSATVQVRNDSLNEIKHEKDRNK